MIIKLQESRTEEGINFFKLFIHLGSGAFLTGFAPGVFNLLHPKSSATIIIFSVLVHYLGNLLALIFQEPRPFWYSSSIKGVLCEKGFGNPCLTVLVFGTLLPIIFIEIFHSTKLRYIPYICLVIFMIIASFNGIYLGEAFPHQVITTLFMSFALVTLYFSLSRQISGICFDSCYGYTKNRKNLIRWIIFVLFAFAVVNVVQHILYVVPPDYAKTVSNSLNHCENDYEPNGDHNYKQSLEIFYALGFICGNVRNSKKMTIYWMITSWWKRILRFAICSGINIGIYYGFRAIPVTDFFMTCCLHFAVPYFFMSFMYTGILPPVFAKFGMANALKPDVDSEIVLTKIEDKVVI